jgi:hypothetical protein
MRIKEMTTIRELLTIKTITTIHIEGVVATAPNLRAMIQDPETVLFSQQARDALEAPYAHSRAAIDHCTPYAHLRI